MRLIVFDGLLTKILTDPQSSTVSLMMVDDASHHLPYYHNTFWSLYNIKDQLKEMRILFEARLLIGSPERAWIDLLAIIEISSFLGPSRQPRLFIGRLCS